MGNLYHLLWHKPQPITVLDNHIYRITHACFRIPCTSSFYPQLFLPCLGHWPYLQEGHGRIFEWNGHNFRSLKGLALEKLHLQLITLYLNNSLLAERATCHWVGIIITEKDSWKEVNNLTANRESHKLVQYNKMFSISFSFGFYFFV